MGAAADDRTRAPEQSGALQVVGAGEILVACGGVRPRRGGEGVMSEGVEAIFGLGANIPNAAREILQLSWGCGVR